jgi:hypothetical protein
LGKKCHKHGRHDKYIKSWSEKLKERIHWEDLGIDGENIIMVVREIRWEVVDWIVLAQDRD